MAGTPAPASLPESGARRCFRPAPEVRTPRRRPPISRKTRAMSGFEEGRAPAPESSNIVAYLPRFRFQEAQTVYGSGGPPAAQQKMLSFLLEPAHGPRRSALLWGFMASARRPAGRLDRARSSLFFEASS